jgi:hypothetical protein
MRIREAQKHTDPTDADPEHWLTIRKKSQNRRNQSFSYYFRLVMEGLSAGAGSGAGSVLVTNIRILRIRIPNTGSRGRRHSAVYAPLPTSVADPGSGAFLTPGSGMGRKSASGSGIRDEQPESYFLELGNHFFGLKYLNCLMRIRDPGWRQFGSGMEKSRIRNPG